MPISPSNWLPKGLEVSGRPPLRRKLRCQDLGQDILTFPDSRRCHRHLPMSLVKPVHQARRQATPPRPQAYFASDLNDNLAEVQSGLLIPEGVRQFLQPEATI